jgi:hypothetical protein
MRLARRGIDVEVVEINPNALGAARDFFNFDESSLKVYLMDARTFVKECRRGYDLILVDLFQGDGIPDYLVTREFFHDIKGCLSPGGLAVFNTFADPRFTGDYYHIIKTLKSEFGSVVMYHDDIEVDAAVVINIYLSVTDDKDIPAYEVTLKDVPEPVRGDVINSLKVVRPIDEALLNKARAITDEHNFYPFVNMENYMSYRKKAMTVIPPEFLVN